MGVEPTEDTINAPRRIPHPLLVNTKEIVSILTLSEQACNMTIIVEMGNVG